MDAALTLSEAATLLNPPMTERQLRQIVTALGWQPAGWRHTGRQGHPTATYPWADITALHQVLVPWLGMHYPKPQATALPGAR